MLWQLLDMANYSITDTELSRHLDYLSQKGYLRVEAHEHEREDLARVFVGITSAGIDLVCGLTTDIGVEV